MSTDLSETYSLFSRPAHVLRAYRRSDLRPDLVAGLTVAVILLPQGIAYALIVELPPQLGLYAAIVAAIIGALWGSSHQVQTGPTNTLSLLVLSALLTSAAPGAPDFVVLAGLMAVLVGLFQLAMGLARLGVLVNFVSHSVIVGFSSGAGVLIAVKQMRPMLGLELTGHDLAETLHGVLAHLPETHQATAALGLGTIALMMVLRKLNPKLPGPLICMVGAAAAVGVMGLDEQGVVVIGQLPRGLPPLARLPILDLELIAQLSTGALAVAAIGLVETTSIARSIASQTGQRLDSNQEFVGQGLANVASGFLSGYPCAGSFTRSAVNFEAGAQTPVASVFSGLFVLMAMLLLAPLAAFVPRAALAGVLILTGFGMIDRQEIARIWRGTRGDTAIMVVTFLATLFLHLEFAVLTGILLSFAVYIIKTSAPRVFPVLPDDNFWHFTHQPQKPQCPQLGILDISGDLYFGAVSHIEKAVHQHLAQHPEQRFLLLRMHSVDQCDMSGIHALESILQTYQERDGDVFMVRARGPVLHRLKSTGFYEHLGADHFLSEDQAIGYLFYKIMDPAVCIYECPVRAFKECQKLPKRAYPVGVPLPADSPIESIADTSCQELWRQLHDDAPPLVIDVREPREFKRGHIPQARLIPLLKLLSENPKLPRDRTIVIVCRSGRRSRRATCLLRERGYENVVILRGGMLAWEAAGLLDALGDQL